MLELIVATGQDLIRIQPEDARWNGSKLLRGRGISPDDFDTAVFDLHGVPTNTAWIHAELSPNFGDGGAGQAAAVVG